jgi:hypothetical protein
VLYVIVSARNFFEDIREIWGKKKRTYGTDKEF